VHAEVDVALVVAERREFKGFEGSDPLKIPSCVSVFLRLN
jgi:hypothetical protein